MCILSMFTYSVSCSCVYRPFNLPGFCLGELCSEGLLGVQEEIEALIFLRKWGGGGRTRREQPQCVGGDTNSLKRDWNPCSKPGKPW